MNSKLSLIVEAKDEGFLIFSHNFSTSVTYFSGQDKSKNPVLITHNMKFDTNGISNLHYKDFLEIYLFSFDEGLFNIFLKDEVNLIIKLLQRLYDSDKTEELMNKLTEKSEESMKNFNLPNKMTLPTENSNINNDENKL